MQDQYSYLAVISLGEHVLEITVYLFLCFGVQEIIPFAVVGSNTLLEVNGKRVRGRLYPWGVVEGT